MTPPPRLCRWLLDAGAALVPADARADWQREWRAEIHAFRATAAGRARGATWRLAVRCLGAIVHAAWLRWDRWRLDMWTYDLRIAARSLWRQPAFLAAAVLTLAIGIGANAAVFSVVHAVLLRPLPFPDADRLVAVATREVRFGRAESSPSDFADWHDGASSFEALSAFSAESYAIAGETPAEQARGATVTGEFFAALGVPLLMGRGLGADDARAGAAPVAVVGEALWARRFARRPDILGHEVTVDGVRRAIVGVMPPGVSYPLDAEVWIPLSFTAEELATQRGALYLDVVGRLRADRTMAQADADLQAIAARLAATYPRTNAERSVAVRSLRDEVVGDVGPTLLMLLAAAGLVLLTVCVNVSGLVLTRALDRSHEVALRAALGAAPWRLLRAALAETAVLAAAGGAGGVALAWLGARRIATLDAATNVPRLAETRLDGPVLAVAALLAVVSALAVGLVPAWRAARATRLLQGHDGGRTTPAVRSRSVLVVAEVALALVLVVGAVTLVRSFARMIAVPRGFEVTDRVLTAALTLPEAQYSTPAARAAFVTRAIDGVRALPDVESAGAVFGLPLTGFGFTISVSSRDGTALPQTPQDSTYVAVRAATPGYFRTMGIALTRGRDFASTDAAGQPRVIVVSESAARLLWPDADPLGHEVRLGTHLGQDDIRTGGVVVGVVADVREGAVDRPPRPTVFVPHAQEPTTFVAVVARGRGRTPDAAALGAVVRGLDPDVPLYRVRTLDRLASTVVARPRLLMALMSLFAISAWIVAAVGLYGLFAQGVAARVREIGVRRAVGATGADVVRLVAGRGLATIATGALVGTVVSWLVSDALGRFVFGQAGPDPAAYAAAVAALAGIAVLAAVVPCRRALAVDPAVALKAE